MWKDLRIALATLGALTLLTGLVYPLLVWGVAQTFFPHAANGSLIERADVVVGSRWIGQSFEGAGWFRGRPSATSAVAYDARASSGSNLGPTNPDLEAAVSARVTRLNAERSDAQLVPVDLVTSSASGLDPHISPASARFQIERVARERGMSVETVQRLVDEHVEGRLLFVFGEPRVNVLELNLALSTLANR